VVARSVSIKERLRLSYGYAKSLATRRISKKIFIIGSGRSGTHWVASILAAHPQIHIDIEKRPIFSWAKKIALQEHRESSLLPRLLRRYDIEHALVEPLLYADKSHPNLWIADKLAARFPEASFIAVKRSVFGTVASMLKHRGVMRQIQDWERYPIPNRFLGIHEEEAERYASRSLASRCALRWLSHAKQIDSVRTGLGQRCMLVNYEDMQRDSPLIISRLFEFLSLRIIADVPEPRRESFDRWRQELSRRDIQDIEDVVANYGLIAAAGRRRCEGQCDQAHKVAWP
jgi:Sulfotransferase domain